MKDPTIPDPLTRKKIMFYETEKLQADFRIRLRYDGMNQSHFFRAMITGYLEKDPDLLLYLDKHKSRYQVQGIKKRDTMRRMYKDGDETKKQFGLNENEIDNIFDLIAEEHPDL